MAQAIKSKNSIRFLACFLLGALMPLGFAPWHQTWLVVVLLACQVALSDPLPPKKAYSAWLLFGMGFFGVGLLWTSHSIHVFGGMAQPFAILFAMLLAFYCSCLLVFPLMIAGRFLHQIKQHSGLYYALLFPSLWLLGETLRANILTGFPWLLIGYAHSQSLLKGWFAIGSVYLVTWISVSISGLLYWACKKNVTVQAQPLASSLLPSQKPLCGWAASSVTQRSSGLLAQLSIPLERLQKNLHILSRLKLGFVLVTIATLSLIVKQIHWTHPTETQLTVTLVQGNTDVDIKWQEEHAMDIFNHYWRLTEPHLHPAALIIWPETALTIPTPFSNPLVEALQEHVQAQQATLLFGVPHLDATEQKFSNRVQMIGLHQGMYEKSHLLPFGDYIPLEKYLGPLLQWLKLPMSDFKAGQPLEAPLAMGGWRLAPNICYEIAFATPTRKISQVSDFIITVSNDGWFGSTIGPWQHFQIATVRALENGRPVLRATNTGVTGIINADGQVLATLPQFEANTLTRTLAGYQGTTPWQRFGLWPVILFILVSLGVFVHARRY